MTTSAAKADLLPDDLLWADGGHASDVVLTALADGQHTIVPEAVQTHVSGCRACTLHLGNAALLSLHAGGEIAVLKAATPAPRAEHAPLPRLAIALALVVAVLGLLPSLLDAGSDVGAAATLATHAPVFVHGLAVLAHRASEGTPGLVFTYGGAALIVAMALAAVRSLSKKEASE
jgi:hypothetical protein